MDHGTHFFYLFSYTMNMTTSTLLRFDFCIGVTITPRSFLPTFFLFVSIPHSFIPTTSLKIRSMTRSFHDRYHAGTRLTPFVFFLSCGLLPGNIDEGGLGQL